MFELFVLGGVAWMTALTLFLLALLLAAWKAPAWVKEIGIMALVIGVFATLIGIFVGAGDIAKAGDISSGVIWGGMRIAIIPTIYGVIIYFVSLVIRLIQKPRI